MKLFDNRLIALGTIGGALLTAAGMVAFGISYTVQLRDDATASTKADADHEVRIRVNEAGLGEMKGDVREIKTDVTWIRHYLDRQQPGPAVGKPAQTAAN